MRTLTTDEVGSISAAGDDVWYNIGHAAGEAYVWAVGKTTDFFEWVGNMLG